MRANLLLTISIVALSSLSVLAAPPHTSSSSSTTLYARDGCSGGVHVCCGSTSVGCSGNVCKACCGSTCGCFYERGSICSSDPNVTPCVDVTKPDFAMTNGKCVAPAGGKTVGSSSSSSSSGSTTSTGSGTTSTSNKSVCSRLPASYARLFGC